MKLSKKIALPVAGIAVGVAALAGCTSQPNAQQQEQAQQQQDTQSLINNQPIPHFNWSQYRQTLIDAEQIAANGTQTTSLFFNQGDRDPIFICPSLGMPVPNTAQLSNPNQIVGVSGKWGGGHDNIAQMDPYGAYTPSASTGTYVVCINAAGKPYLNYWEGFVESVTAGATWNYGSHTLNVSGAPTTTIHTKSGS